jgi:hypothetical protein
MLTTPPKESSVWLVNLAWNIVSSGDDEKMGIPARIVQDACSVNSWGGWGFYNHNIPEKQQVISSIPVLLFEAKEDAFMFRLKYPGESWVPMISTDKETHDVRH